MKKSNSVVTPNYQSYAEFGKYVCVNNKIFQVAPENVVHEDGSPWWYHDEAKEFAKDAPYGWRLPTPVEANLIAAQICYDAGSTTMTASAVADALDIDYVGTGISLGHRSDFFVQNKGTQINFWTDCMREITGLVDMPSGYALALNKTHNYAEITSILTEDRGACVRLIREVTLDEIAGK